MAYFASLVARTNLLNLAVVCVVRILDANLELCDRSLLCKCLTQISWSNQPLKCSIELGVQFADLHQGIL